MEEIFLRDYANNVAQAQDPFGVAAVQAQPGFENYTPSFVNQELQPMGFAPEEQKVDLGQIGKDLAVNVLKNEAIKKLGLKTIEGNILSGAIGMNPFTNPIGALYTVGSLLPDNVKGIAGVLRRKRADKVINKAIKRDNERDTQGDIKTINLQNTGAPSPHTDPYSGGSGGVQSGLTSPTVSAPPSKPSRQSRQTAGVGGLHSGY